MFLHDTTCVPVVCRPFAIEPYNMWLRDCWSDIGHILYYYIIYVCMSVRNIYHFINFTVVARVYVNTSICFVISIAAFCVLVRDANYSRFCCLGIVVTSTTLQRSGVRVVWSCELVTALKCLTLAEVSKPPPATDPYSTSPGFVFCCAAPNVDEVFFVSLNYYYIVIIVIIIDIFCNACLISLPTELRPPGAHSTCALLLLLLNSSAVPLGPISIYLYFSLLLSGYTFHQVLWCYPVVRVDGANC